MSQRAIIIGASHAGAQLALSLRLEGWTGEILVVGNEPHLPYHRPPLSKDFLSGNKKAEELLLRPPALYEKNNIEFRLNTEIVSIDRSARTVALKPAQNDTHQVEKLDYDKLAFCTGARVRELPIEGITLPAVHYLRNLNDVEDIRASLSRRSGSMKGAIIGGGYIGLETAAMLNKMGHQITVLEAAPQLLGRVAAKEIGEFYQALHNHHGVDIKTGVSISHLAGTTKVEEVVFNDGSNLSCDFVIVGIGVLPNQELAADCGIKTNNGILVDEFAQTNDPNIVAAGDCTRFQHPRYGELRLESVPNATEQAKSAAASICGTHQSKQKPHHSLPWFWSDQYNCKLQIAGISSGYDQIVLRGSTAIQGDSPPNFCVYYFKNKELIAADCINRPKEFMLAKLWLQNQHTPDTTKLIDDTYALSRDD